MPIQPTAERLSIMLGLLLAMLATLPRYVSENHDTRLLLILIACAVVGVVGLVHWRMLPVDSRSCLPSLMRRLGFALMVGLALMGGWHAFSPAWVSWQLLLSHGVTAGLLLHVLGLWWKPSRQG